MAGRRSLCRRACARPSATNTSSRHDHQPRPQPPRRHIALLRARPPTPPIPAGTLEMFLELLRAKHGAKLLRVKGIVKLAEMPDTPVVVHGVQHVFHPTARLERWPDDDHRTRLVFITRDLPERTVRELFEAFLGSAAPRPPRSRGADRQSAGAVRRRRSLASRLRADSRLRGLLDVDRSSCRSAGESGGRGKRMEPPWNGSGCGTIRRACPPRSTRRAIASLVAMFEESFSAYAGRDGLRLHGQDADLCRARRGLARLRRLAAEPRPASAARASPS